MKYFEIYLQISVYLYFDDDENDCVHVYICVSSEIDKLYVYKFFTFNIQLISLYVLFETQNIPCGISVKEFE